MKFNLAIPTQGCDLTDAELVDLISEMSVMSKSLEAYEGRWGRVSGGAPAARKGLHKGMGGKRRGEPVPAARPTMRVLSSRAGRKSCAITCAVRLSQFLGDERIKDKVSACVLLRDLARPLIDYAGQV